MGIVRGEIVLGDNCPGDNCLGGNCLGGAIDQGELSLSQERNGSAISFIISWDFSMFWQIFLLPQVKRCAIITYKHTIYELPHELPNALKLRILGNIKKLSKLYRMIGQCPVSPPKQNFWNVELVPDILWAIVGHPVVLPPHSKNCSTLMQSLYYWISK